MAQDEISKGSVKSGPPPPSAEGGGVPDFKKKRKLASVRLPCFDFSE